LQFQALFIATINSNLKEYMINFNQKYVKAYENIQTRPHDVICVIEFRFIELTYHHHFLQRL